MVRGRVPLPPPPLTPPLQRTSARRGNCMRVAYIIAHQTRRFPDLQASKPTEPLKYSHSIYTESLYSTIAICTCNYAVARKCRRCNSMPQSMPLSGLLTTVTSACYSKDSDSFSLNYACLPTCCTSAQGWLTYTNVSFIPPSEWGNVPFSPPTRNLRPVPNLQTCLV